MIDNVLLERIRKMHAKAESAKQLGNEAEAFTFASAVQKLLLKHDLTMSGVEALAAEQNDPIKMHEYDPATYGFKRTRTRVAWTQNLAKVIAKAHGCEVIPIIRSNKLMLVGTREHRQVCEFKLVTLTRYAQEHSEKDYVKFFYECMA